MPADKHPLSLAGSFLTFFLLCLLPFLWSCAPLPDMVSRERPPGGMSADEIRQTTVDQPFMVSGEYFMKREPAVPVSRFEAGAAPADSPAPRIQPPAVLPAAPFPIKIGVLTDRRNVPGTLASDLADGLRKTAARYPVIAADQVHINETLSGPVCKDIPGLDCMAGALSHYPGVRMLFLVESVRKDASGTVARVSVVDTGLLHQYPLMEIRIPPSDPDPLAAIWETALRFALSRSGVIPWFCRAFGNDGDIWYLSAGAAAGLKPGDRLSVQTPGRVILSPSGMPAGRLSGVVKGDLEITALLGKDFSAARLAAGKAPSGNDILVPAN